MAAWRLDDPAQVCALADVLLGAAHSDHFYAASELVEIIRTLCQTMGVDALPEPVSQRLKAFDPAALDLEAACAALPLETPEARRSLLALVAKVINADAVIHEIEDEYLDRVAEIIGVTAFVEAETLAACDD